jgi:hypothetical protein
MITHPAARVIDRSNPQDHPSNCETSGESTGISYVVDVDSPASGDEQNALLEAVDSVAEIPKSIRAGTSVERVRP